MQDPEQSLDESCSDGSDIAASLRNFVEGQTVQLADPVDEVKVPAEHVAHWLASSCSARDVAPSELYLPAGQFMHMLSAAAR